MDMNSCELDVAVVSNIDLVCPVAYRDKVLNWIYANGGDTRRVGPLVKNYRADPKRFHVIGHVVGVWTQEEIEKALSAL